MSQRTKPKLRNVRGRKPPQFADMISTIMQDAHLMPEELNGGKPIEATRVVDSKGRAGVEHTELPEGTIVVEGLNGVWLFSTERLFRHIDRIALALGEFDDEFWEGGGSLYEMRFDRKDRTWGNELHITSLAYLAIAAELAEWTQPRALWKDNPQGLPIIKFTFENPRRKNYEQQTDSDRAENPNQSV